MPSLKSIRTRIASVKSTQKITRAMKLVAASKMKRATDAALASRPYSDEVRDVLASLVSRMDEPDHPLLKPHPTVKKAVVVVLCSDKGLCGGFNSALLRKVDGFLWEHKKQYAEGIELATFGRKGRDYFRRRSDLQLGRAEIELSPKKFQDYAHKLIHELSQRFETGEIDEVYLAYNRYVSTLTQTPTIEQIFPLTTLKQALSVEPEHLTEFVYEPSQQAILGDILPLFLRTRIFQVFLESEAGEHAARMMAMDGATRNAKAVIDKLTLQYNRARQAAITKELIEIVSGAEAL
jgi:F-type H+-transporting ATPase subunit gamma